MVYVYIKKTIILLVLISVFLGCTNKISTIHDITLEGHKSCTPNKDKAFLENEDKIANEIFPYVIMANNSYGDEKQISLVNYSFINRYQNNFNGFSADIYENIKTKEEVVIAFRGTESIKDIIYGTILNNQMESADKIYKKIKDQYIDHNITVTGHSLGGALALNLSTKYKNLKTIVFNTSFFYVYPTTIDNNRIIIHEDDEILDKYLNKLSNKKINYNMELSQRFNFLYNNQVSLVQHGIYPMARGILLIAAKTNCDARKIIESMLDCKLNLKNVSLSGKK